MPPPSEGKTSFNLASGRVHLGDNGPSLCRVSGLLPITAGVIACAYGEKITDLDGGGCTNCGCLYHVATVVVTEVHEGRISGVANYDLGLGAIDNLDSFANRNGTLVTVGSEPGIVTSKSCGTVLIDENPASARVRRISRLGSQRNLGTAEIVEVTSYDNWDTDGKRVRAGQTVAATALTAVRRYAELEIASVA